MTYTFGPFRLEVRERRLLRDGQVVPLRAKPFDTLALLAENPGRLLTKRESMHSLWPDTAVEENNLNHNVSILRRVLGESATGQSYIETVPRIGYRFVADVVDPDSPRRVLPPASPTGPERSLRQEIRFCVAPDGVRIAYSTTGDGPPLVKAANFLNHLEFEWESPAWRHWIHEVSRRHTFVRYDESGCGLSDWQVPTLAFESWVHDLETVVDRLQLERFDLLGISQGGAVAAAYAARHPERVQRLVVCGGFARGWQYQGDEQRVEAHTALIKLMRLGWGQNSASFRQIFTALFLPEAGAEEMEWFSELQRISSTPENAARLMEEFRAFDVRSELAHIQAPALVFHSERDDIVPFNEGRLIAAGIPRATFVPLASRNHLLLAHEPAWGVLLREIAAFLRWTR